MRLRFLGRWPDPLEQPLLQEILAPHIPDGESWIVRLATGVEQVLSYDPAQPWDVDRGGRPLELHIARTMRLMPRYISWEASRPDLRFASANGALLLAVIFLWNEVGPDRMTAEIFGRKVVTS